MPAAITQIIDWFVETISSLRPTEEPGQRFVLNKSSETLTQAQPGDDFHRSFRVTSVRNFRRGESYLPLHRIVDVLIEMGYADFDDDRIETLVNEDEELIARHLLAAIPVEAYPTALCDIQENGSQGLEPVGQAQVSGGNALVHSFSYEVQYQCEAV